MVSKCFQNVPKMFPKCSQSDPKMFPKCSQNVSKMFPKCSQSVPKMFSKCSQNVPKMFIKISMAGHGRPWSAMAGHGRPYPAMAPVGRKVHRWPKSSPLSINSNNSNGMSQGIFIPSPPVEHEKVGNVRKTFEMYVKRLECT